MGAKDLSWFRFLLIMTAHGWFIRQGLSTQRWRQEKSKPDSDDAKGLCFYRFGRCFGFITISWFGIAVLAWFVAYTGSNRDSSSVSERAGPYCHGSYSRSRRQHSDDICQAGQSKRLWGLFWTTRVHGTSETLKG